MNLSDKKYSKYHITNPNLVSKIYFSFIYYLVSKIVNYENKKILDFGGGQGFLKKRLTAKYSCEVKLFDIIEELSELKDWKKYRFDIIIFCQVIYLLRIKEFKSIIENLKKRKKILILSIFSKQTVINKLFAYLLGHKEAHDDTIISPKIEREILINNFKLLKNYNFYLFEILLLKN